MKIKKILANVMCASLILSNLTIVSANNVIINETSLDDEGIATVSDTSSNESGWITDESDFADVEVTYKQSSSYFVTIPKTIALDSQKQATYSIKVSGDIDTNQRVYVAPVDAISNTENIDFYMKDQNNKKDDVVATITQNKFYWNSEEVSNAYEEINNSISAPGLTSGTWKGTFQVEINLQTEDTHEHNYIDGRCECGEIDPNHTHNYVDGACTICGDEKHIHNYVDGKCECGEVDSYSLAPEDAYINWNYTLDEDNKTITLNYYSGSETDVIVYSAYPVNGTIYNTKIASNTSNQSSNYMFAGNNNVKSIKFSGNIDTSETASMSYMFDHCGFLTSLDVSNLDTSNATNMRSMFNRCDSLASLDLSNFVTSNVTDMSIMFGSNYTKLDSLTDLNLSSFDTSNVTTMRGMFAYCESLTSLDLSNFDTSNVTDMGYMFNNCNSLTELDVSNFDTSNVTDMSIMFDRCSSLTNIDVSNFDTGNVTNMSCMFCNCSSLTSLNLSNFDTSNVTTMSSMFRGCSALTNIDISNFDTSHVTLMETVFEYCSSLTSLDLSSFDTGSVTSIRRIFSDCSKLKTIYVTTNKWSIKSNVTKDGMFSGCGTSSVIYK